MPRRHRSPDPAQEASLSMSTDIYTSFGVTPVLNVAGYVTAASGGPILPEVAAAMRAAANSSVLVDELEQAASREIAAATGAEAGYVTSGAAAALSLAAAAVIAGDHRSIMNQLPDVGDQPHEIVIAWTNRSAYDRCFRAAGARVVVAGSAAGCTPDNVFEAIGPATVAVAAFASNSNGAEIAAFAAAAHHANKPLIVDAAMALPPAANLRGLVAAGADLVAFSGGKELRGPQASGFLAGPAAAIESVALQHQDFAANDGTWEQGGGLGSPGHGIGRAMKVGKEEIVGLLTALRCFATRDHAAERVERLQRAHRVAEGLQGLPGLAVTACDDELPRVDVEMNASAHGMEAIAIADRLLAGDPRIVVGPFYLRGKPRQTQSGSFWIAPYSYDAAYDAIVIDRVRQVVAALRK